jgi:pimeloyl-ACP methyl ester carboxylesterase
MHVRLARALATSGFSSLRFDFSGIGDSGQRRDSLAFEESSVAEVREAMDYMAQSRGTKRFILMGLCSGADMSHLTAVEDGRVRGLVFIDGWAYRNARYWIEYYARRSLEWTAWRDWTIKQVRRAMGHTFQKSGPSPLKIC